MLNGIGIVYDDTGKHTQALNIYQQALAIHEQFGIKENQAETINNIGLVYSNLGQYAKALEFHQQALAISQQIGDIESESISFEQHTVDFLTTSVSIQKLYTFYQKSPSY